MPKASVNGVSIYYESHGDGFPLVLTYCLGGNARQWRHQVHALSKAYRLILWDPRGHGGSESPPRQDQYGVSISAEDLHGLMNHLGLAKAYVGGLSMGGGIATRFTLGHPERVAALLIMDSATASGLPRSPEMLAMRQRTIELAETRGMEAVIEYAMAANPNVAGRAGHGQAAAQTMRDMYLALDPMGYANTIRALLSEDSITDQLHQIRVPTLVLAGEDDPALPSVRLTHAKIASSELVTIPGAGHFSNLDQPDLFNQQVLRFLAGVDLRREGASQ
jgi:pimeloyl-ACP methyl ester carboxylesterase